MWAPCVMHNRLFSLFYLLFCLSLHTLFYLLTFLVSKACWVDSPFLAKRHLPFSSPLPLPAHQHRFSPSLREAMTGGRDKKPNRAVFGGCSACSGERRNSGMFLSAGCCKEKELLWPGWHVQRMRLPQCRVRSTRHTVGEAIAEVGRVNNASSVAWPGHLCACGEDS